MIHTLGMASARQFVETRLQRFDVLVQWLHNWQLQRFIAVGPYAWNHRYNGDVFQHPLRIHGMILFSDQISRVEWETILRGYPRSRDPKWWVESAACGPKLFTVQTVQ